MTHLKVGVAAPDFTLPLGTFGTISLSNMRGRAVVLYFYPKDDTPGCTVEACNFQESLPQIGAYDTAIIGISKDDAKSHAAFAKKYNLQFHLASDIDARTAQDYGVWVEKNNYGTKYMGTERSTFLIDKHGIIRKIWSKVKVEGHVDEVKAAVEALYLGTLPAPVETPAKPAKEAAPKEAEKPVTAVLKEKTAAKPAKPAAKKAVAKPAAKPAPAKAAPKAASKTVAKAPAKSSVTPKAKAAVKPAAKPVAAKPTAQKVVKATAKPAAKPTVKKPLPAKAAAKPSVAPKAPAAKATAVKKAPVKKVAAKPAPKAPAKSATKPAAKTAAKPAAKPAKAKK